MKDLFRTQREIEDEEADWSSRLAGMVVSLVIAIVLIVVFLYFYPSSYPTSEERPRPRSSGIELLLNGTPVCTLSTERR